MRQSTKAVLLAVVLCVGGFDVRATAAGDDALEKAILAIRGVRYGELTREEKKALDARLDSAWKVLLASRGRAKSLVEAALDAETSDGFFLLELSELHLTLTEGSTDLGRLAEWVIKADPNANPPAYWTIAKEMSASRCAECRPVLVRAAKLRFLDAYIAENGLRVDVDLALLFLWGAYRDELRPELDSLLRSDDCAERGNAAFGLGLLRPDPDLGKLREMALGDSCAVARRKAWAGLAMGGDPDLGNTARQRLMSPLRIPSEERWAMIQALTSVFAADVRAPLETLARDEDPEVAADARRGVEELAYGEALLAAIRGAPAPEAAALRDELIGAFREAVETGRFDHAGGPQSLAALESGDLPLVHRARLAVLSRFSEECLHEFRALSGFLSILREPQGAPGGS